MAPRYPYPQHWSDMSTDFKLLFGYHGSMMVLMVLGAVISARLQLKIVGVLVAAIGTVSLIARRKAGWRWRGVGIRGILDALLNFVLAGLFFLSVSTLAPPLNPMFLPWYLGGVGIVAFATLSALNVTTYSQSEFLDQCRDGKAANDTVDETAGEKEALWRRAVRAIYSVAFLGVWLAGVASFYLFGKSVKNGSAEPSGQNTVALMDHGNTVYVTQQAKDLIDTLQSAMSLGIPAIMAIGAFLHFVLHIEVLSTPVRKKNK